MRRAVGTLCAPDPLRALPRAGRVVVVAVVDTHRTPQIHAGHVIPVGFILQFMANLAIMARRSCGVKRQFIVLPSRDAMIELGDDQRAPWITESEHTGRSRYSCCRSLGPQRIRLLFK